MNKELYTDPFKNRECDYIALRKKYRDRHVEDYNTHKGAGAINRNDFYGLKDNLDQQKKHHLDVFKTHVNNLKQHISHDIYMGESGIEGSTSKPRPKELTIHHNKLQNQLDKLLERRSWTGIHGLPKDYKKFKKWCLNFLHAANDTKGDSSIRVHLDWAFIEFYEYCKKSIEYEVMRRLIAQLDKEDWPGYVSETNPDDIKDYKENDADEAHKEIEPSEERSWIQKEYQENSDDFDNDDKWAISTAKKFQKTFKTSNRPHKNSMKRYGKYKGRN